MPIAACLGGPALALTPRPRPSPAVSGLAIASSIMLGARAPRKRHGEQGLVRGNDNKIRYGTGPGCSPKDIDNIIPAKLPVRERVGVIGVNKLPACC